MLLEGNADVTVDGEAVAGLSAGGHVGDKKLVASLTQRQRS